MHLVEHYLLAFFLYQAVYVFDNQIPALKDSSNFVIGQVMLHRVIQSLNVQVFQFFKEIPGKSFDRTVPLLLIFPVTFQNS